MAKKIMTLDSLYQFFVEQNKSFNFSSKESGSPIVVTSNGHFAKAKDDSMPGMLKLKLKNCHIDTNRNGSHISKENMEKAMPTLKYRPILAYIHELPDGTKDFFSHNVEFVEDAYSEILKAFEAGLIKIRRYEDMSDKMLSWIENTIKNAKIVEVTHDKSQVSFGSTVTIFDLESAAAIYIVDRPKDVPISRMFLGL